MSDLKPCPFCGSNEIVRVMGFHPKCKICGCIQECVPGADACEMWNMRAKQTTNQEVRMSEKFGVTNHVIDGQESNTSIAMLGNGKIRVQALYFDNGCAGICIVDDNTHVAPYSSYDPDELKDNAVEVDSDKVVVMATNRKSLQVIIDRLTESMQFLPE